MKSIIKIIIFSIIFTINIIWNSYCFTQTKYGKISGRITDEQHNPLYNVNVFFINSNIGTISDKTGNFSFSKILPGKYTLKFTSIGYHSVIKKDIIIKNHEQTVLQIVLKVKILEMQEIIVMPGNFSISQQQITKNQIINKKRIKAMPGTMDDICRIVQNMPGVAVSDDFSAHFHVRGGRQNENLILLDGMEIFDPYHLKHIGGAVGVMNMDLIENVSILTGGFPAKYGDKLSSVVVVNSRNGDTEKFKGKIGGGGTGVNLLLEGPILNGSWILSARKSFLKEAAQVLNPTDFTYSPSFYDIQSRLALNTNSNHQFFVNLLYSKDNSYIEKWRRTSDLHSNYGNRYYGFVWKYIINPKIFSELIFSNGHNFWDNRMGEKRQEKLKLAENVVNWNFQVNSIKNNNFEIGTIYKNIKYDYNLIVEDLSSDQQYFEEIIESYYGDQQIYQKTYKLNGYIQDKIRLTNSLIANLGVRYDYFEYNQDQQWSPRIGLAYSIPNSTLIRAAWGHFYQSPIYTELTNEKGEDSNPQAVKAEHYVLGIEHSLTNKLSFRIESYLKEMNNMIGHYYEFNDPNENPEIYYGNPNKGYSKGIEFFFNGSLTDNLTVWLSYAYSETKLEAYIVNWESRVIERKMISRYTEQPHNLSLFLEYKLKSWEINLKWRYLSGIPYTPRYANWSDSEAVWSSGWSNGNINTVRYPDYHRLDIRIGRKFIFNKFSLSTFFEIKNFYYHKNVFLYDYEIQNNKHHRNEYHMLPFFPTIEFSLSF